MKHLYMKQTSLIKNTVATLAFGVMASLGTTTGHAQSSYCSPTYSNGSYNWNITDVSISETGFSDAPSYTNHDQTQLSMTPVQAGSSYSFSVGTDGWISVGVAVDFNGDYDFDDAGEILAMPSYVAYDSYTYTFSVTIPSTVADGNYRMRFWNREANSVLYPGDPQNDPCGAYGYGSWVDYTLPVTNTLSTDSFNQGLSVAHYPNPVTNTLHLEAYSALNTVQVSALTGQVLLTASPKTNTATINVQSLALGVYIVSTTTVDGKSQTFKIVKH